VNRALAEARRATERRATALRARRQEIATLSRRIGAGAEQLATARALARRKLSRQFLALGKKVERRFARQLRLLGASVEQQARMQQEAVARLRRRALLDAMVVVSALPLSAAFGSSDPLGANNIAIALLLLVWLVGDGLVDLVSGARPDPAHGIRDTDLWSYLAPFANVLAGWLLLHETQRERFVTGIAQQFEPVASARGAVVAGAEEQLYQFAQQIDLAELIAPEHFALFQGFPAVPAVPSLTAVGFTAAAPGARVETLSSVVAGGALTVALTVVIPDAPGAPLRDPATLIDSLRIAWMVDTATPA
jgi:hypothetical protein